MKIERDPALGPVAGTAAAPTGAAAAAQRPDRRSAPAAPPRTRSRAPVARPAATVSLSARSRELHEALEAARAADDVRADVVKQIKTQVDNGTYVVDPARDRERHARPAGLRHPRGERAHRARHRPRPPIEGRAPTGAPGGSRAAALAAALEDLADASDTLTIAVERHDLPGLLAASDRAERLTGTVSGPGRDPRPGRPDRARRDADRRACASGCRCPPAATPISSSGPGPSTPRRCGSSRVSARAARTRRRTGRWPPITRRPAPSSTWIGRPDRCRPHGSA